MENNLSGIYSIEGASLTLRGIDQEETGELPFWLQPKVAGLVICCPPDAADVVPGTQTPTHSCGKNGLIGMGISISPAALRRQGKIETRRTRSQKAPRKAEAKRRRPISNAAPVTPGSLLESASL